MRRPCFAEGDVGLACIAITEPAGFSGTTTNNNNNNNNYNHPFFSRSRRSSSYRSLSSFSTSTSSPRSSARLYDARCEEHHQPHFLEACFLCKKPLGDNRDIFMYRGDTPFCSEECRQEQIEKDEAKEKNYNLSVSMKAMRKETSKTTANKSRNYQARTSPVAAS